MLCGESRRDFSRYSRRAATLNISPTRLGAGGKAGGMEWLHWTLANAVNTLAWWASDEPWKRNGHNMVDDSRPIQVSVRSDAATETYGWGGTLQVQGKPPLSTRENFTAPERKLHINALELLGCWFTIYHKVFGSPCGATSSVAPYTY